MAQAYSDWICNQKTNRIACSTKNSDETSLKQLHTNPVNWSNFKTSYKTAERYDRLKSKPIISFNLII